MPYLVDGHNLLGQIPGLSLSEPSDRQRLVTLLAGFARTRRCTITVVFDGAPPSGWPADRRVGRVRVLHAGGGRSADDALLDLIRRAPAPRDVILVTSDRALYERGRHLGAQGLHGHKFREILAAAPARGPSDKPDRSEPDEVAYYLKAFGADPPRRPSS
jgi:predicted RNA-binding protein with PIN domain